MQRIGGVGQAARASGLARDIRTSHPWGVFAGALRHESVVRTQGDVMARLMVRCREVLQSAGYVDRLLDLPGQEYANAGNPRPDYAAPLAPSSLAFGWSRGGRGETCHVLLTDAEGRIAAARINDPEPPQLAGAGPCRARRRDLGLPDLQQEFQSLLLRVMTCNRAVQRPARSRLGAYRRVCKSAPASGGA